MYIKVYVCNILVLSVSITRKLVIGITCKNIYYFSHPAQVKNNKLENLKVVNNYAFIATASHVKIVAKPILIKKVITNVEIKVLKIFSGKI